MSLSASQKQFIQNIQSDAYFYGSMIVIGIIPLLSNGYGWVAPSVSIRFHSVNLAIGVVLIGWAIYHWIMMNMHRKHAVSLVNNAVAQNLMSAESRDSALRAIDEALKPIERRVYAIVGFALVLGLATLGRSGYALYKGIDPQPDVVSKRRSRLDDVLKDIPKEEIIAWLRAK